MKLQEVTIRETDDAPLRAVMSLVRQGGKVLAVRIEGKWTLPGAILAPGETEEDCQARGLRDCVGMATGQKVRFYAGPNSTIFIASLATTGTFTGRVPCAWLTETQFLQNARQTSLFKKVFEDLARAEDTQSRLVKKSDDGRQLFAIQFEVWEPRPEEKTGGEWMPREAHYVHAVNADDARLQFFQTLLKEEKLTTRIIEVGIAIGWHVSKRSENLLVG